VANLRKGKKRKGLWAEAIESNGLFRSYIFKLDETKNKEFVVYDANLTLDSLKQKT